MIHIVKLCVGAERVEDLLEWQAHTYGEGPARHVTRMWPKRTEEVLDGGSLYWVFKGVILARQRIIGLEEVIGADGIARCAIVLDRDVVRTEAVPRRPFQGWRYLAAADAPADHPPGNPPQPRRVEIAQIDGIRATLEEKYGRKVQARAEVESDLIGGVCIRMGDEVIDASVRGKLARLAASLKN